MAAYERTENMFKIIEFKDQPDGTAIMTYEVNNDFKALYREMTGKKRATVKGLNEFVLEMITKGSELDKNED